MYIEHKGKIYVQKDDVLVGVNICPDITLVKGTETTLDTFDGEVLVLTGAEVHARYNISEQTPYHFPVEVVEEKETPKRGKPSTK
jgi:hypothetical protein